MWGGAKAFAPLVRTPFSRNPEVGRQHLRDRVTVTLDSGELREAAALYERAVDLTPTQQDKLTCRRNAENLTKRAAIMEAGAEKFIRRLGAVLAGLAAVLMAWLCARFLF